MEELITLQNVSKNYGNKSVLNNINLSLLSGETLAIIGVNGAGKSTLLKVMAGLCCLSNGKRIERERKDKIKIGYVPEHFPKLNFTPYEYICHMGKMQGLSQANIYKVSEELFDIFNITSMKDTRIKFLSKGTIQKVAVVQAIIEKPDILLLDEPLSGQDIESQEKFIGILQKFKTEKICIALACHERYLVDKLADKVVTIEKGEITSNISNKNNIYTNMLIRFRVSNEFDAKKVKEFGGIVNIVQDGQLVSILVDRQYSDNCILKLLQLGCSIVSVKES